LTKLQWAGYVETSQGCADRRVLPALLILLTNIEFDWYVYELTHQITYTPRRSEARVER